MVMKLTQQAIRTMPWFWRVLIVALSILALTSGAGGAIVAARSSQQAVTPRPGLWEGPFVSFLVQVGGSIVDLQMRAPVNLSHCEIEVDELEDQPVGGLSYVALFPEENYWYNADLTHEERLSLAAERGVSWPDTVEFEDGYMIKAIDITGTFTSSMALEGTYRINVCGDQLFLWMEDQGEFEWSAEWVRATAANPTPRPAVMLAPTEPPTPDMTGTYAAVMADALATITAESWTHTPAASPTATNTPSNTPTPTPSPTATATATPTLTLTPSDTPTPTPTPIPPQRITTANVIWLEETDWVSTFGEPVEIVWSPDGQTLVASTSFEAALYDPDDLNAEPHSVHTQGFVESIAISPDGTLAAFGNSSNEIVLWNIRTDAQTTLRGHTSIVDALAFSPDGTRLASGSWDDTVRMWDVATGEEVAFLTGHEGWVHAVGFSPDGRMLASGGESMNGALMLWDVSSGQLLTTVNTQGYSVTCLAFSPDGRYIATGEDYYSIVRLWDAVTSEPLAVMRGHTGQAGEGGVFSVAFSPDSTLLATGGRDKTIRFWDVAAGSATFGQELMMLTRHTDTINTLAFSPDGTLLVSGGAHDDSTIRLWGIGDDTPPMADVSPVETEPEVMGDEAEPDAAVPAVPNQAVFSGTVNQDINLRAGPGTDEAVLGTIRAGGSFTITGRNAAGDWLFVQISGDVMDVAAWVYAPLVNTDAPLEELPVVDGAAGDDNLGAAAPAEADSAASASVDGKDTEPTPTAGEVNTCIVTTSEVAILFPSPSLEDAMPDMVMAGTELALDGWYPGDEGFWYRTVDGQWVLEEILFLGEEPPADCESLPQVTP